MEIKVDGEICLISKFVGYFRNQLETHLLELNVRICVLHESAAKKGELSKNAILCLMPKTNLYVSKMFRTVDTK